jgi:predicted nuclease of predicted toxin-antitoxin system
MPWKKIQLSYRQWQQLNLELSGHRGRTRFLLDENMPQDVTAALRRRRYSTMTVADYGFADRGEDDIFALAKGEDRVLVTQDEGFLDEERFPLEGSPGVAILPPSSESEDRLSRACGDLLRIHGDSHALWYEKKAWIAGDGTVSVRFRESATGHCGTVGFLFPEHGPALVWEDQ